MGREDDDGGVGIPSWGWRILLGWLAVTGGLVAAAAVGVRAGDRWDLPELSRLGLQAGVMTGVVVPLIYLLRRFGDRQSIEEVGLTFTGSAARHFLFGLAVAGIPTLGGHLLSLGFGWSEVVAMDPAAAPALAATFLVAFLLAAFPQEVAVRGYLYRNLSARMSRWIASVLTVGLFVLIAPAVSALGVRLPELEPGLAGNAPITLGALITLTLLGTALQFARVATGSVWTPVGLHLGLLCLGRLLGPGEGFLFQIEVLRGDAPGPGLAAGLVAAAALALALPAAFEGRSWGWRERDPEAGA